MHDRTVHSFSTAQAQLMLSNHVNAYGINLQPAERVAEEVMKLNAQLAKAMRETGTTVTVDDLDHCLQVVLQKLDDDGICQRGEFHPPIIPK